MKDSRFPKIIALQIEIERLKKEFPGKKQWWYEKTAEANLNKGIKRG